MFAQPAPSDRINFGHIGIGGRGSGFLRAESGGPTKPTPNLGGTGDRTLRPARSVALCDVDSQRLDKAATRVGGHPKLYKDFRRLLEDKGHGRSLHRDARPLARVGHRHNFYIGETGPGKIPIMAIVAVTGIAYQQPVAEVHSDRLLTRGSVAPASYRTATVRKRLLPQAARATRYLRAVCAPARLAIDI